MSADCHCSNCIATKKIEQHCARAIKLAEASKAAAEKDGERHPAVGAIILDEHGNKLAEGYRNQDRDKYGKGSHAEIVAFGFVKPKDRPKIHTLITTLEPCSFRSKTDVISCARRTVHWGVKQVIVGCLDPAVGVRGHAAQLFQDRDVYFNMFPIALNSIVKGYNEAYLKGLPPVKQDRMLSEDLDFAPPCCVEELKGDGFQSFAYGKYERYIKQFGKHSTIRWPDFFIAEASRSGYLEKKKVLVIESVQGKLRKVESSVYDQLAAYLAIAPDDPLGRSQVYGSVGEWWITHRAKPKESLGMALEIQGTESSVWRMPRRQ